MKKRYNRFDLIFGRGWILEIVIKDKEIQNWGSIRIRGYKAIKRTKRYWLKWHKEREMYNDAINGDGMCLICGEINFHYFQEHHIDKEKMPDFTITLCANHHTQLHRFLSLRKNE